MARLYALTGVLLPETPPFATEGHLTGKLGAHGSWLYDQFTGTVGRSDIGGKLAFKTGTPRPLLSGTVQSKLLQVSDLGPLIGADSNASKEARGADTRPAGQQGAAGGTVPHRALDRHRRRRQFQGRADHPRESAADQQPRHPVAPERRRAGADAAELRHRRRPLHLHRHAGRQRQGQPNAIRAELKAGARKLQLKQLFPHIDGMQATVGEINADLSLSATGNSVASLLAPPTAN
jgi:uncharacterized protein involved in outer membrane biogenesis